MKKDIRRRLLSVVLTFAVLPAVLGAAAVTVPEVGEASVSAETDDALSAGSGLTEICRNGSQILLADPESGEFAVRSIKSGYTWYSNPQGRENDPYAGSDRANVSSVLTLHCLNTETMVDEYLNSFGASVLDGNVSVKATENGLYSEYRFADYGITVPLEITLTDNGFKAAVDVSSIKEKKTYKAMDLGLLPFFGAGGVRDDGYMVVPDGCGALIHFNNGKQGLLKYANTVYGNDAVLSGEEKGANCEFTAIPLFGLKNGENGFAAIITEGDAAASVNAGVSMAGSGYNNVYANFALRSSGSDTIGGKKIRTYEKTKPRIGKCEVTFSFLTGKDAGYVGVADAYRGHLEKQMKTSAPAERRPAVFLELYGAIRVQKSVMGFPARVIKPLTTFEQAEQIVSEMRADGVDSILVDYQNADTASLKQKLPSSYCPNPKLGGKRGYKKLSRRLTEWKIPLISNVNLTTFQNSGNGYSVRTNTAQLFTGLPGLRYFFKLNTGEKEEKKSLTYFLAPGKIGSAVDRYIKKYDPAVYGNIGLDTMATDIYSDFRSDGANRQKMLNALVDAMASLSGKCPLYLRGGNGRLIPYASYVYDLPGDSSRFDQEDESVPLYQIAISGLVPYSLKSVNSESDVNTRVLKCVEYGADLKFNFSYTDFGIIGDADFGYLNGTVYDYWKEYAAQAYRKVALLDGKLGSGRIVDHTKVGENVYVTSYENGTEVIVNYNEDAVTYGNVNVPGKDFAVVNGGETGVEK